MQIASVTARTAAAALLLVAGAAQAHVGAVAHDHGTLAALASGLLHPLGGWDHLLAMVGVGLWSSAQMRHAPLRAQLIAPALFVAMLLAGAVLPTFAGGVETAIALSVALIGAMLLAGPRLGLAAGMTVIATAGLFHGQAHGAELGLGAAALSGMVAATAALHGAGLAAGRLQGRAADALRRAAAWLMAASGLVMLLARV